MKNNRMQFFILVISILSFTMNCQLLAQDYSNAELKLIKKCRPGLLGVFDRKEMREFILLMNLARQDGKLCVRYIQHTYGVTYTESKAIRDLASGKYNSNTAIYGVDNLRPILRPSLGLKLSAVYHAVGSGLAGSFGHQALGFRVLMGLNFKPFFSSSFGENCEYGSREGIDIFISLMNSQGHKRNILSYSYHRVGVAHSFHLSDYDRNTVTVFSGKKLW